ncbi:hypothetical protein ABEF93_002037 [Exophiala dermatitidis]
MHKAKAVTSRPDVSGGSSATSRSASAPNLKTFQFVTANPASEAEKSQNKALVRSNASNFYWRRVKKTTTDPSTSSNRVATRRRSSAQSRQTKPPPVTLPPPVARTLDSPSTESGWSTPKTEESHNEQNQEDVVVDEEAMVSCDSSLSSLVVSGHHDPFQTYPCDLPREFVSRVLDQINGFLSLMFPPQNGRSLNPLAETWLRTTFSDRGLFHASLFSQLMRNRVFSVSPSMAESREQVHCYTETIRGVHQKFKDTSMSLEDENILSVYALSYHGDLRADAPAAAPSQGPLTTLQLLHVYGGRLQTVQVHLQGLAKMLSLRGGLSKIKLPGLSQAISFGDIVMASQTLSRPMLPYVAMHEDVTSLLAVASRKNHPLVGLGRGFRILPEMLSHDEVSRLLVVLRWIIQYTFAVDDHVERRPEAQSFAALMDQRNFVQHSLMLLTPETPEAAQLEHPMHRLSRLATLIYSLLVVFPVPAIAAPFHRLARDVKAQLADSAVQARWTEGASDLLLWVTVMGAIAAIGSPDRQGYLARLDRLTRHLNINSWAGVKDRLKMFLWFDYTNDSDGLKLWRELEESSVFRMPK